MQLPRKADEFIPAKLERTKKGRFSVLQGGRTQPYWNNSVAQRDKTGNLPSAELQSDFIARAIRQNNSGTLLPAIMNI